MISTLHDSSQKIFAYCEWWVTDGDVCFKADGEYLYIRDLWIHPAYRGIGAIESLIDLINFNEFSHSTKWVYWNRGEHYNKHGKKIAARLSKPYKKETALRRIGTYGKIENISTGESFASTISSGRIIG